MRLLHTSDWHLGRSFHQVAMLGAQEEFLDHLVKTVVAEQVDVVVVAGDVYDRALPPVDAVALLDEALDRLVDTGAAVLVTSGNHDSAQRLGFGGRRSARAGLHLRTRVGSLAEPVLLDDRHGPVALYGIPYLEPGLVHDELRVGRCHAQVLGAAMDRVRADLAGRPETRSVVAAHAFVTGAEPAGSERDIRVGGIDSTPRSTFDGVDYVAMGHLHSPQRVSETIRYCGSPLPYSFSERAHSKGSWLVDLDAHGVAAVEKVEAPVHRRLAVLRGRLDDLLTDPAHAGAETAYCQVVLTDAERPREPMERLRRRFPHTVSLVLEPEGRATEQRPYAERVRGLGDAELCCAFLADVRGRGVSEPERELFGQALEAHRMAEAAR